jgi:tetratricopeptide (TPR) repeat protein
MGEACHAGFKLTKEQVSDLEDRLAEDPTSSEMRSQLIGYYFKNSVFDGSAKDLGAKHVLWLVENQPQSNILNLPACYTLVENTNFYQIVKQHWSSLTGIDCSSISILENAAEFFYRKEPEVSIALLERAVDLESANFRLLSRLTELYQSLLIAKPSQSQRAEKALTALDAYIGLENNVVQKIRAFATMCVLARASHDLVRCKRAVNISLELSKSVEQKGQIADAIHRIHTVRGLVSLDENDIEGALVALNDSIPLCKTPVLSSFGPEFDLANNLLVRGERKSVCEYLSRCAKIWKNGQFKVAFWLLQINLGQKPALR